MTATTALVASPGAGRRGSSATSLSTPAWLRLTGAVVILLILGFGAAATLTVQSKADSVSDVVNRSEPLSVAAQVIYRSLSDADATAASAFLIYGPTPPADRARYEADVAEASTAVSGATGVDDAGANGRDLTVLATQLPVYAGLVESARIDNLQQLPVGAAYQEEASQLMRSRLLPAAQDLYRSETAGLASDYGSADAVPVLALVVGVVVLAVLVLGQAALFRRTNRVFNIGLGLATAAVLASVLWVGVAWLTERGPLGDARDRGSSPVEALSAARFAALQARTDESLMLISRDGEDTYSADFDHVMGTLNGTGGLLTAALHTASDPRAAADVHTAMSDAQAWTATDHTLRQDADGAVTHKGYDDAVVLATGTSAPSTASESAGIDQALSDAIQVQQATFAGNAGKAADALSGVVASLAVLALVGVAAAALGLRTRLREYQ